MDLPAIRDAKNPYLAQYSAVELEFVPVKVSYTTIKNNIPIKNILKPLNTNFKILLTGLFLLIADCITNR